MFPHECVFWLTFFAFIIQPSMRWCHLILLSSFSALVASRAVLILVNVIFGGMEGSVVRLDLFERDHFYFNKDDHIATKTVSVDKIGLTSVELSGIQHGDEFGMDYEPYVTFQYKKRNGTLIGCPYECRILRFKKCSTNCTFSIVIDDLHNVPGMLAIDTVCATASLVVDAVGVVINILLGVAVYQKKTKEMESYSILLMNTVISDFITCLTSLFVGPRMILFQDSLIYIFSGGCTFFGSKICYIGMGAIVAFFAQTAPVLLYSFAYRYFVIRWEKIPKKNTVVGLLAISWLYPVILLCFVSQYIVEHLDSDMSNELRSVHPELNISSLTIAASPSINSDYRASIPTICVVVPVVPILILSLTLRHIVMKKLATLAIVSEKTRQLNNNLMQACLPLCLLVGAVFFMVDKQFQIHNTLLEYGLVFMVGTSPVLSPVSAFYFITPYREWLKHKICCCVESKDNAAVGTTNGTIQSRAGGRNTSNPVHQRY